MIEDWPVKPVHQAKTNYFKPLVISANYLDWILLLRQKGNVGKCIYMLATFQKHIKCNILSFLTALVRYHWHIKIAYI